MDMYMLYAPDEKRTPGFKNFLPGALSYVAHGESLFSREPADSSPCSLMVVSASDVLPSVSARICDEARLRSCRRIFIDSAKEADNSFYELCTSLLRSGLKVFSPYGTTHSPGVIPVVDTSVTGGFLAEIFNDARKSSPEFAISLSPLCHSTPLPAETSTFRTLSRRELFSVMHREDVLPHFSPQMNCKYFLTNPYEENTFLFLFDDGETISSKIRLAKKHGASHAFFVYSEISDILSDISF